MSLQEVIPISHSLMFVNALRCADSRTPEECEKYVGITARMMTELRQTALAVEQCRNMKVERSLLKVQLEQKCHDYKVCVKADQEANPPKSNGTTPNDTPSKGSGW